MRIQDRRQGQGPDRSLRLRQPLTEAPDSLAPLMGESVEVQTLLEDALTEAQAALNAEAGIVYLVDRTAGTFRPVIHHGISQDALTEVTGFKKGEGLSGAVAESGKTVVVADLAKDVRNLSPAASREGWHGYAGVPIRSKDRVLGVMVLVTHQEGYFTPDCVSRLNHIGDDIEVAMENVRLCQEARLAEVALHDSEERYRALFEESRDAVYSTTRDGRLVDANQSFSNLFGHAKEETMNLDVRELYANHDDRSEFQRKIEHNGSVRDYEVKLRKKDGTEMDCLITATLRKDAGGNIVGYQGIIRDITEQKRSQEALHGEKEKFRVMVEESPLGVSIIDKKGDYKYINAKFTELFGYTLDDIHTGRQWFKRAYPDEEYRKEVMTAWINDLKNSTRGESRPRTFTVTCKDGSEKVTCFRPVTMDTGDQFIIYEDITERKQAEAALQESEERYRMLFNSGSDAVFVHYPTPAGMPGKFVEVNDVARRRYGYTREELLNLSPLDLSVSENLTSTKTRMKNLFAERHILFETVHGAKDGRWIPVEISSHLFSLKGQPTVLSIARDITERKRMEDAIRKREMELKTKATSLEETNTALKVLLEQRERDKTELEEKVLTNVKELVLPCIERLKRSRLKAEQRANIDVLESHINDLVSPLANILSSPGYNLTFKEMQVASLVKEGKANKEIADLLHISVRTVRFHRENIRKKLGLRKKKLNLRSHLFSLE